MASLTRIYRRQGLLGDDAEAFILREFEWDAKEFFHAPVMLTKARRVNGTQYVEYTFERDEMAIFTKAEPMKKSTLGLGRLKDAMNELRTDVRKEVDGAVDLAIEVKNDAKSAVGGFKQQLSEVLAEVTDAMDELKQITNGAPE